MVNAPLQVGLINFLPLGDRGVVGSGSTLHVGILPAMTKSDVPEVTSSRLERYLEISLVSVGIFVPSRARRTVLLRRSLLVQNEMGVGSGTQEKVAGMPRNGLDDPLEVGLIDPTPRADLNAIGRITTENVQEGSELALYGNFSVYTVSGAAPRVQRVVACR